MSRTPPEIRTTDYHTGGEPFRIVVEGAPALPGASVRERRERAIENVEAQSLRRLLCHEPRGHADMYGCFIVPPDDEGADLGVLFWHKDGFSTACGHGTIALGAWAIESGLVEAPDDGTVVVTIDVPSGRVAAVVKMDRGEVGAVTFRNVPSYVMARAVPVPVGDRTVGVDLAFGGAIYASVPAVEFGLIVAPEHLRDLIAVGRTVKQALAEHDAARHPSDDRLSGIYGTILYDEIGGDGEPVVGQRNVTVFADGEVDRSPCGSGTSARLALLHADGRLAGGVPLSHESIVGTHFEGRVVGETTAEGRPAVLTEIGGLAFRTGEHRFVLDPRDPLAEGFVLR